MSAVNMVCEVNVVCEVKMVEMELTEMMEQKGNLVMLVEMV